MSTPGGSVTKARLELSSWLIGRRSAPAAGPLAGAAGLYEGVPGPRSTPRLGQSSRTANSRPTVPGSSRAGPAPACAQRVVD